MSTPEELFHEAMGMAFKGGRFNPTTPDYDPDTVSRFAYVRNRGEKIIAGARRSCEKLPPIHFDFAPTDEFNAWAFIHGDQFASPNVTVRMVRGGTWLREMRFIGVSRAAVFGITLLLERMISDCRVLTHIGDPKEGTELPPVDMPSMSRGPRIVSAIMRDKIASGPMLTPGSVRTKYCVFLVGFVIDFLIFHELAHIMNGHVDYGKSKNKLSFLAEFGATHITKEEIVIRNAMESDADTNAIQQVAYITNELANNDLRIPHQETYNDLLFGCLFSVFTFFRIFGDTPLAGSDLFNSTHPPDRIRVACAWSIFRRIAHKTHGITIEVFDSIFRKAAFECEQAFHFLTGESVSSFTRYTEALNGPLEEYRNRIGQCWNNGLRQDLADIGYGNPMFIR